MGLPIRKELWIISIFINEFTVKIKKKKLHFVKSLFLMTVSEPKNLKNLQNDVKWTHINEKKIKKNLRSKFGRIDLNECPIYTLLCFFFCIPGQRFYYPASLKLRKKTIFFININITKKNCGSKKIFKKMVSFFFISQDKFVLFVKPYFIL